MPLQRGRAQLSAEVGALHPVIERVHRASTGPRSIERGGFAGTAFMPAATMASTGPRSIERGGRASNADPSRDLRASTGPRSIERGGAPKTTWEAFTDEGLQRGRAQLSAEVGTRGNPLNLPCQASTGPRSIERGGTLLALPIVLTADSFNGAALN